MKATLMCPKCKNESKEEYKILHIVESQTRPPVGKKSIKCLKCSFNASIDVWHEEYMKLLEE